MKQYKGESKVLQYFDKAEQNSVDLLLQNLLKWQTAMDCEMPSSPDTLHIVPTGFASMAWITFIRGAFKSNVRWSNAQRVSAPTNTVLSTTAVKVHIIYVP